MWAYDGLRGEANEAVVLVLAADVHQDGHGIVDLEVCVLQHGQAHIEADFYLYFAALLMHDVLEIDLQVVEQVSDGLALAADEEVVHFQLLLVHGGLGLLHFLIAF